MESTSSSRFNAGQHHQDYPAFLGGILDTSGLAAIFTGLESAGLPYVERFAGESPGDT